MMAEDRARDSSLHLKQLERFALQDSAHAQVVSAQYTMNLHRDRCEQCRLDGRKHVNWTVGQF
jgi:hypothetical protein